MNDMTLTALATSLPARSYRYATQVKEIALTSDLQASLGSEKRRAVRLVNIVLDVIANKLFVEEVRSENTAANEVIKQWQSKNQWDTLENEIFRLASRDGQVYVLVAWNNDGFPTLRLIESYDGISGAAYITNPITGSVDYGVNIYRSGERTHIDVYYTDRVEQYVQSTANDNWTQLDTIPWIDSNRQPLGMALIKIGSGTSDIADAIQTQNDYNAARLDQLATSRTQGFPREYIKTDKPLNIITNEFGQPLVGLGGNPIPRRIDRAPGSIQLLPSTADYGQLEAAEIDTALLEAFIEELSLVSAVPAYYLKPSGEAPSGRSLLIQEGRLNAAVEKKQSIYTPQIKAIFELALRLSNYFAATTFDTATALEVEWAKPEIYDSQFENELRKSRAEYILTLRNAGTVSIEAAVRYLWPEWNETEVANEVARIQAENGSIAL